MNDTVKDTGSGRCDIEAATLRTGMIGSMG